MFAWTRSERLRRRFVRKVQLLLEQSFPQAAADRAELDRVWSEWLSLHKTSADGLVEILVSDARDVFKARALVVLLVPRTDYIPFTWYGESLSLMTRAQKTSLIFSSFSRDMVVFASELLHICLDTLQKTSEDEKSFMIVLDYSNVILELLKQGVLEDIPAQKLFERFQLNDPVPFSNMDEASGYMPFRDLLFDPTVPEHLKRLADEKMRQVIVSEEEGETKPRRDWEEARYCYLDHIELCLVCETFPYSEALFASQVEFLLGLYYRPGEKFFLPGKLYKILTMLPGEDRKELRNTLARWMILGDHSPIGSFRINNGETLKGAKMVLAEFGESDVLLGEALRSMVAEAERSFAEDRQSARRLQERESAVMQQMR